MMPTYSFAKNVRRPGVSRVLTLNFVTCKRRDRTGAADRYRTEFHRPRASYESITIAHLTLSGPGHSAGCSAYMPSRSLALGMGHGKSTVACTSTGHLLLVHSATLRIGPMHWFGKLGSCFSVLRHYPN